jgi:hypothetical protein
MTATISTIVPTHFRLEGGGDCCSAGFFSLLATSPIQVAESTFRNGLVIAIVMTVTPTRKHDVRVGRR